MDKFNQEIREIMRPFFSVIVCTYNRIDLIGRALNSLQQQTEQDFEVIVVDDGSTDGTTPFLRFLTRNPWASSRMRLISHKNNLGVAAAKNSGVAHAEGKYITFLDSDDQYCLSHLRSRKQQLLKDSSIEVLHGGVHVIGNPYVVNKDNSKQLIHIKECAVGGTFFIRRDVFGKIGTFHDLSYAEDAQFLARAIDSGMKVERATWPSYYYYRNVPNQLTAIYSKSRTLADKAASTGQQIIRRWFDTLDLTYRTIKLARKSIGQRV